MLGVALEFKDKPDKTTPYTAENMNDMQRLLVSLVYPVGSYYETSDSDFDPNEKWGGTWELDQSGTALVSKSSASSSKFNVSIGTIVGEEEHTLTIDEMPEHNHELGYDTGVLLSSGSQRGNVGSGSTYSQGWYTRANGGGQAHNNIQPSKICYRWHRTA